jgi:lipid A 3-O-deacylase
VLFRSARNIFLDGNTFEDSRSVDKKILVGDLEAGIAITFGDVRLAYTHVYRTEEFHGQEDADLFGTLNLTIRF